MPFSMQALNRKVAIPEAGLAWSDPRRAYRVMEVAESTVSLRNPFGDSGNLYPYGMAYVRSQRAMRENFL
jgi:hypothetical protein